MFPILIHVGPLTLHTYGLLIALAVIVGTQLMLAWGRRNGMAGSEAQDRFYSLTFHTLIGGLIGARAFYVVTFWEEFSGNWTGIFKVWEGGLVFYGGLVGGAIGFILWKKRSPEIPWLRVADAAGPALVAGHALGRLGCFFAGCCYGLPTNVPWAVTFTRPEALAPLGTPLHPTQLYEFAFLAALGAYLWVRNIRPHRDGTVFADYLTIYPVGRFFIEHFRADPALAAGLTSGQIASLALFGLSFLLRFSIFRPKTR